MWDSEIYWVAASFKFKMKLAEPNNRGTRIILFDNGNGVHLKCIQTSLGKSNAILICEPHPNVVIKNIEDLYNKLNELPRFIRIR